MNILILGAHGQIARLVRQRLLAETDNHLTSYLRHADRLQPIDPQRETLIEGDVNDYAMLQAAMVGQDIVYANLGGTFEPMVKNIVQAMTESTVKRLIYVTGLGLYHELPAKFDAWLERSIGHEVMEDTRRAAQRIETSPLTYTIIRAGYMTNDDEVDYDLTEKGETFKGTTISRASIADLIMKIMLKPDLYENSSLGIAKPGTDGDTPVYR
ncbi:short-chain dehydrogenase [Lactobacillus hokkaidonensis JCM] [Lactiplantibacillus mudanjiangensis]|uniref:NAD(P)H-binding protein n=1 Tax=Lactiplantibacillus mudanjiangensis TaxID=1296538 RepID=UPI001014E976|nr:NAD(P)H-binding protein [Lactiplantibacillus mudanjiangensis]VDG33036.1 short-chain dehydrogenase [Lactobacillus hokkaidonensis JCM] [Lactiplantibacillus mudanjiangensis]